MIQQFIKNIDGQIGFLHVRQNYPYVDFHLHQGCEIYFLMTGDLNYFVEKTIYSVKYGDLFITNNHEIHKPAFITNTVYERITFEFNPEIARAFSSSDLNLLNCFYNRRNGEKNKISLGSKQVTEILDLFHKYERLCNNSTLGNEILKLNCFVEILVCVNRGFMNSQDIENCNYIPKNLSPILNYIDEHINEDLSLETIENKFFISRFYLSRIFKRFVGSTIHEYIIYKRIAMAKILLSEGCNVTEACIKSGFNDYSNFLKMFKKTVGIQPGKYIKMYRRDKTSVQMKESI